MEHIGAASGPGHHEIGQGDPEVGQGHLPADGRSKPAGEAASHDPGSLDVSGGGSSNSQSRPALDIAGGGLIFSGRASLNSEDLDASVVDVKINEAELEQFDDEFSFDDTVTSDSHDPDAIMDAHSIPDGQPDEAESGMAPYRIQMAMPSGGSVNNNRTGPATIPAFHQGQGHFYSQGQDEDMYDLDPELLGQRMEATGERAEDQVYGRDGVGSEDQGFHARIHNSFPSSASGKPKICTVQIISQNLFLISSTQKNVFSGAS